MPDFEFQGTPFSEAIEALRSKEAIPTERYDQWMGAANAKGFVVAGATKIDLVKDIQAAMVKAQENGTTLADFRKDFKEIVNRHGWTYKGSEGWRAGVIYNTNMRTARMAGRWQQIQATKKAFPYLVYMTVGDEHVRHKHERWHKLALPVDDAWWNRFYPPNDWGCRCYVISATAKQLQRMGIEVADRPQSNSTERVIPSTGEVYGQVPEGIGTGWEYNPGKAWLGPDIAYGQKLAELPPQLMDSVFQSAAGLQSSNTAAWQQFLDDVVELPKPSGRAATVGWIDQRVYQMLRDQGETLSSLAIVVFDKQLDHLRGDHKRGKHISADDLRRLPQLLQNWSALLRHKQTGNLVFVLPTGETRRGRAVVHLNFRHKGGAFNSVRSLGEISINNLRQTDRYELLLGEIE